MPCGFQNSENLKPAGNERKLLLFLSEKNGLHKAAQ